MPRKQNLRPLTADDLDRMGCQDPACDHSEDDKVLYLHPKCHPGAGTYVYYDKGDRTLTLECTLCKRVIVRIGL
jgi:hypothetical protein